MRKLLLAIAVTGSLAGCAIPLKQMDADFLCQHYGANAANKTDRVSSIRAELNARKLISEKDWGFVDRQQLYVGMPTCAMFAIQGGPYSQNRTTTAAGTSIQHAFTNHRTLKREYLYTTNGLVTAWQN